MLFFVSQDREPIFFSSLSLSFTRLYSATVEKRMSISVYRFVGRGLIVLSTEIWQEEMSKITLYS